MAVDAEVSGESVKRPRTFNGALAVWPQYMDAANQNPCDSTLAALCTLLDVMDGEIVRRWDEVGHVNRMAALSECRRDARHANALVGARSAATAKERGEKAHAAKLAKAAAS